MVAPRRPQLLSTLLCCALLGCAGGKALSPWLSQTGVDHPGYPRSRYLTAVGISSQSASDAEAQARRAVSERISSQLRAETDSFQQASSGGQGNAQVTLRITTSTSFSRADLIDVVDRQESGGTWYALGALDRQRADAELGRATQADLVKFSQYVDSALAARQQGRPGDFSTARQKAMGLLGGLDSAFITRRAIAGRAAEEAGFLDRRNRFLQVVAEADGHRQVQVRVDGQALPTLLTQAVSAVRKLGVRVAEAQSCAQVTSHPEDVAELVVTAEESCTDSSLGEKCSLAVRLHARGCGGGAEGEGRTQPTTGLHPSEREWARKKAWEKLTQETVDTAVAQALRSAQVIYDGGTP